MTVRAGSQRAARLATDLRTAAADLLAVLEEIEPERWSRLPGPGVWSVGKDAAHVAEATVYHQWIVRLTIGQEVPSRRPPIERLELTTSMSAPEAMDLIRRRTEDGDALISSMSDDELTLPTRPPRARGETLAETVKRVLIGHYHGHRRDIERKLREQT
ncbi:MAG: DinB family protein [Chloroflexota bacterium]|nr:MAG: DinB family protein [Chloroflexota bacterium]